MRPRTAVAPCCRELNVSMVAAIILTAEDLPAFYARGVCYYVFGKVILQHRHLR
jgi:hypothetical protein